MEIGSTNPKTPESGTNLPPALRLPTEVSDSSAPETTPAESLDPSLAPEPLNAGASAPHAAPVDKKTAGIILWVRDLAVAAIASALIITFLYQPVRVEGTSMLPRLENSDRLFINKFVYHFAAINRGDVIVFRYPLDPEKSFIKRVIALPGDTIRIDRGRVIVNGQLIREPYVPQEYRDTRSLAEMTVPADSYFVLGDHRNIAADSRDFGPVERSLIYGKAVLIYWPAKDAGVVR